MSSKRERMQMVSAYLEKHSMNNAAPSIKSEPPEDDTPLSDAETEENYEVNDYTIKRECADGIPHPPVDLPPIVEDPSFGKLFLDHEEDLSATVDLLYGSDATVIGNMAAIVDSGDQLYDADAEIPAKRRMLSHLTDRNGIFDYQESTTSSGTQRDHQPSIERIYLRRMSTEPEQMEDDGIDVWQPHQQEHQHQHQQPSADDDNEDEEAILDRLINSFMTNNTVPDWPLPPKSQPGASLKSHDRSTPFSGYNDEDDLLGFFRNADREMGVDLVEDDAMELLKFVEERNAREKSDLSQRYDTLKDELGQLGDDASGPSNIRVAEIEEELDAIIKETGNRREQQLERAARELKRKQEHQMNDYLKKTLGNPNYDAIDEFFDLHLASPTFEPRNEYEAFIGKPIQSIKSESVILVQQEMRRDVKRRKERGDIAAVPAPITQRILEEKERYLEKIRAVLIPYFDSGRINENDYKNIAREMTRDLHERDMDGKAALLLKII